jgi:hypothetical protein
VSLRLKRISDGALSQRTYGTREDALQDCARQNQGGYCNTAPPKDLWVVIDEDVDERYEDVESRPPFPEGMTPEQAEHWARENRR